MSKSPRGQQPGLGYWPCGRVTEACLCWHQGPEHSSARLERYLQMVDENPYEVPKVDESKWFSGGHLGGQIQKLNWQV